MRKLGLLINPHAKKARVNPSLIRKMIKVFPNQDSVWSPDSLENLSKITRSILEQKIEVLFLSGGDGTFRATVESFLNHRSELPLPSFVLLQGGTGNLYSRHYFGSKSPLRHLSEILKLLENEDQRLGTTSVNILEVNGHYGFIFAIGGFANIIRYYMSHAERSIALANWILFRTTISFFLGTAMYRSHFPTFSLQMKSPDQKDRELNLNTLSCSTLPVGYILKPFFGINLNESFSTILFKKSPYRLFLHLFSLWGKKKIESNNVEQFSAKSLELFLSDPLQAMVDGDMLEPATRITVKLGPQINLLTI